MKRFPKASSAVSRRVIPALAIAAMLLLALPVRLTSQTANTDDVKAAFLFNFARFVEWPAESTSGATAINLGVLGSDSIGDALRTMVKDKTVAGRRLTVRRASSDDDLSALHLLFISQAEKARVPDVIKRLEGSAVLTVSDVDRFCESGGVIGLVVESNHVRFDVSLGAAERSRLRVSSKLLNLARKVHGAKQGERS
jgi:hypothetical protein